MNESKNENVERNECCPDCDSSAQPCEEPVETAKPAGEEACCPTCSCHAKPAAKKTNIVIGSVILLAVCCIILFKAYTQANEPANVQNGSVPDTYATAGGSVSGLEATEKDSVETHAVSADDPKTIGTRLASMSELNTKAVQYSVAFIYIPSNADDNVPTEIATVVDNVGATLKKRGATLGLFTLDTTAPDYASLAEKNTLPAILVACKGFGMAIVSEITEAKLLEAYLASASPSGGCCPSGSGSSSCG